MPSRPAPVPPRRPRWGARRLVGLAVAGLASAPLLISLAVPAAASYAGGNGKIAFIRDGDLWTVNPNGAGETRLTTTGDNAHPRWSPDGLRIAFDSRRSGSGDVYTIRTNGTGLRRVTFSAANDITPTWSPDSARIAFASDRDPRGRGEYDLYVTKAAAAGTTVRLTRESRQICRLGAERPNWSPDGSRIAFARPNFYDFNCGGYSGNLVGYLDLRTGEQRFLAGDEEDKLPLPNWSPDGTQLAFNQVTDYGPENLFVIAASGSGLRQVTFGIDVSSTAPAWSPDDTKVVYAELPLDGSGGGRIVVRSLVDADAPARVLAMGSQPDWQPLPRRAAAG